VQPILEVKNSQATAEVDLWFKLVLNFNVELKSRKLQPKLEF